MFRAILVCALGATARKGLAASFTLLTTVPYPLGDSTTTVAMVLPRGYVFDTHDFSYYHEPMRVSILWLGLLMACKATPVPPAPQTEPDAGPDMCDQSSCPFPLPPPKEGPKDVMKSIQEAEGHFRENWMMWFLIMSAPQR